MIDEVLNISGDFKDLLAFIIWAIVCDAFCNVNKGVEAYDIARAEGGTFGPSHGGPGQLVDRFNR